MKVSALPSIEVLVEPGTFGSHYARREYASALACAKTFVTLIGDPRKAANLRLIIEITSDPTVPIGPERITRLIEADRPPTSIAPGVVRSSLAQLYPNTTFPEPFIDSIAAWIDSRVWLKKFCR